MKVILKCVNIKLWDILGCFHYILNAPRISAMSEIRADLFLAISKTGMCLLTSSFLKRFTILVPSWPRFEKSWFN